MLRSFCKSHSFYRFGVLAIAIGSSNVLANEYTVTQKISQLIYNANADYVFLRGPSPWGAPSCPNATYSQVQNSVLGRKQLLAILLAANLASKRVTFQGSCDAAPGYFNIYYVIVED